MPNLTNGLKYLFQMRAFNRRAWGGFGIVDLDEIDLVSEVPAPLNEFDSVEEDPPEHMATVRETACEQGSRRSSSLPG